MIDKYKKKLNRLYGGLSFFIDDKDISKYQLPVMFRAILVHASLVVASTRINTYHFTLLHK